MSALACLLAPAQAWASPRAYERPEDIQTLSAHTRSGEPRLVHEVPPPAWGAVYHGIDARRDGSNYLVLGFCDFDQACGNDEQGDGRLLKFRIDLEFDIVRIEHRPWAGYWYLTFPFRAIGFWNVFNTGRRVSSSPFVEHDYAPSLELSWAPTPEIVPAFSSHRLLFRTGIRHESNGLGVYPPNQLDVLSLSRSWDVIYLSAWYRTLLWPRGRIASGLELWWPVADEDVMQWPNGDRSTHHLEQHLGYGLLRAAITQRFRAWAEFTLVLEARMYSLQTELRWAIGRERIDLLHASEATRTLDYLQGNAPDVRATSDNFFALDLVLHCVFGRGERLITANEARYACYAGVGL